MARESGPDDLGQVPNDHGQAALEIIALGSVAITARVLATVGPELTFVQWRLLVIVGESSDGTTVTSIASRLGSEISATSRLVTRMARRGLVTSRKDAQDRRVTRVSIAPTAICAKAAALCSF